MFLINESITSLLVHSVTKLRTIVLHLLPLTSPSVLCICEMKLLWKNVIIVLVWLPLHCSFFEHDKALSISEDFVYVKKGTANVNNPPVLVYRKGNFGSGRLALEQLLVHLENFSEICLKLKKTNALERVQIQKCTRYYDNMQNMLSECAIKVSVLYPQDNFEHYFSGDNHNMNLNKFSDQLNSNIYIKPAFPYLAKLGSAIKEVMPYVKANHGYNEDLSNIEETQELLQITLNNNILDDHLTIMENNLDLIKTYTIFNEAMIDFVHEFIAQCRDIDNAISKWFMSVAKSSSGFTNTDILFESELQEIIEKVYKGTKILLESDKSKIRTEVFLTNGSYYLKHNIPVPVSRIGEIYEIYRLPYISSSNATTYWPTLPSDKAVFFPDFAKAAMFMTNEEYDKCVKNELNCLISSPYSEFLEICSVQQFFNEISYCSYEPKEGAQPYFKTITEHIIYSVPFPVSIYALCSDPLIRNQGEKVQIRGRGVIQIFRGCSLYTVEFDISIFRLETYIFPTAKEKPDHPIKILR